MRMMSSGRCLTLPTCVLPCPPMWRCAHRLRSRCNNWKPPACSGSRRWRRASSKRWTIGFARICRCAWRGARSQPQPVGRRAGARCGAQSCSTQHRTESLDTGTATTTQAVHFSGIHPPDPCATVAGQSAPSALVANAPNKKPGNYRAFCCSTQRVRRCAFSTRPQSAARAVRATSRAS